MAFSLALNLPRTRRSKSSKKGSPQTKSLRRSTYLKATLWRRQASFTIGLPGDDAEKVRETIDSAKALNPDSAMSSITMPYPVTELYENIDNYDIEITLDDWSNFTLTKPVVKTSMPSDARSPAVVRQSVL